MTSNVDFSILSNSGSGNTAYWKSRPIPMEITFTITPGATNQALIDVNYVDGNGDLIPEIFMGDYYFSSVPSGDGLITFVPDGPAGVVAGGGLQAVEYVTKKWFRGVSTSAGRTTLGLTESTKQEFYVIAFNPFTGMSFGSRQIIASDYGV